MIKTFRGMDRICAGSKEEAVSLLNEMYENTSLGKREITEKVSLDGLSIGDVVRVYNHFSRSKEASNEKIFLRAA
ncbi:hypothetical protein [Butyrivibrio hungatei]|uniref:Uncharacterized protein n=1 Tax=Butyrivibrio hungatei TaxID=185008 RepID=A0A1D9P5R8_9FIRM|nr:hypothetical protein [Butyrivibrio hungatei]AOZ97853.1 hypothetical protein bhn_II054 [Butyrivibrio hungatei]